MSARLDHARKKWNKYAQANWEKVHAYVSMREQYIDSPQDVMATDQKFMALREEVGTLLDELAQAESEARAEHKTQKNLFLTDEAKKGRFDPLATPEWVKAIDDDWDRENKIVSRLQGIKMMPGTKLWEKEKGGDEATPSGTNVTGGTESPVTEDSNT